MKRTAKRRRETAREIPISRIWTLILAAVLVSSVLGCTAAKEFLALRRVEFRFDSIRDPRVAGISLRGVRSYADLTPVDVGRVGIAIARGDVPLDLTVHIEGRNPESND